MRGTERCDEIVRLIDTALEVDAPAAPRAPSPAAPSDLGPRQERPAGWLRRLPRLRRRDPRFVAAPTPVPSGPARFAAGLRTAGELTGRSLPADTALPEAG